MADDPWHLGGSLNESAAGTRPYKAFVNGESERPHDVNTNWGEFFSKIGAWRLSLLAGVYLIWITRSAWLDRGHHFEFALVIVLGIALYLYSVIAVFALELVLALISKPRVPGIELAARVSALVLAVTPTIIARVVQG